MFDVGAIGAPAAKTISIAGGAGVAIASDIAYVAGADGVLRFSLPDLTPLPTIGGHAAPVISVGASADGKRVVSGSLDGTARVHCLP